MGSFRPPPEPPFATAPETASPLPLLLPGTAPGRPYGRPRRRREGLGAHDGARAATALAFGGRAVEPRLLTSALGQCASAELNHEELWPALGRFPAASRTLPRS